MTFYKVYINVPKGILKGIVLCFTIVFLYQPVFFYTTYTVSAQLEHLHDDDLITSTFTFFTFLNDTLT